MKRLYVLYDAECALCRRCRAWLEREPAYIELHFIPKQVPNLKELFPGIEVCEVAGDILVISDEGAVYSGPSAWIVSLFALRRYRSWAFHFSNPALFPLVRQFCQQVSKNRLSISRWLFTTPDQSKENRECDSVCSVEN